MCYTVKVTRADMKNIWDFFVVVVYCLLSGKLALVQFLCLRSDLTCASCLSQACPEPARALLGTSDLSSCTIHAHLPHPEATSGGRHTENQAYEKWMWWWVCVAILGVRNTLRGWTIMWFWASGNQTDTLFAQQGAHWRKAGDLDQHIGLHKDS